MTVLVFANNATSTLAGGITNTGVTLTLQAGEGALFPNPTSGQYFVGTFVDAATGLLNEIVWCTARSGDTLTIVRAQEGTTALAWNAGDFFSELWTAGQAAQMLQQGQAPSSVVYSGTDTGSTNTYIVSTTTPTLTGLSQGITVVFKVANTNSGASTLNVVSTGAVAFDRADGTPLQAGDLVAGEMATAIYDGSKWQLSGVISTNAPPRLLQSFTTAGSVNWVVPAGVTWIYVELVGGGGGGGTGGGNFSNLSGGGGGGGGYAAGWVNVTPGATLSGTVGAGGPGSYNNATAGTQGGTTTFAGLSASGGGGGILTTGSTSAGGAPGVGSGGQVNFYGAAGGDGNPFTAEIQGGYGGASAFGGGGRTSTVGIPAGSSVINGYAAGSGGGGVWGYGTTNFDGGNGAAGAILISY